MNNKTRLYDIIRKQIFSKSKFQIKEALDGKNAFKELKKIINDNQSEEDWPWQKCQRELETAFSNLGREINLNKQDIEDIYFHFLQGDDLNNKAIQKSKAYKTVKKAMHNLNKI